MKDGQLFRVKVIKDESDLPKEDGWYFVRIKGLPREENGMDIDFYSIRPESYYKEDWMDKIDWYIEPIEISDADIEAWATLQSNPESRKDFERGLWLGLKVGAKAVLNGEIKKIEK